MLYTSEMTGKSYKTVEELKAAENAVVSKKAAEEKEKADKKAELAGIKDAATNYLKLVEANNKARADLKAKEEEAYSKYKEELDKFAAKHNGYHLTYRIDGDNVEFEIEENHSKNLEVYNNEFRRGIKSLFDMFDSLWF